MNFTPTDQIRSNIYSVQLVRLIRLLFFLSLFSALLPLSKRIAFFTIYTPYVPIFLLFYISSIILSIRKIKRISWSLAEKLLFFICIWQILGSIFSVDILQAINTSFIWITAIIFYILIRYAFAYNILSYYKLFYWWIFFLIFLLIIGSLEIITGTDFFIIANHFGVNTKQTSIYMDSMRISGTTTNSNIFGQWITIFSLLGNSMILFGFSSPRKYLLIIFLLLFEFLIILYSLSRGAFLFFTVAHLLLFFIWILDSKRYFALRVIILTFIFIFVASYFAIEHNKIDALLLILQRLQDNSDNKRIAMLQYAYQLLHYPKIFFLGTGMGCFLKTLIRAGIGTDLISTWKDFSQSSSGVHNIPLLLFVEGGVFLVLAFLISYLQTIKLAYSNMRLTKSYKYHPIFVYFFVILVSLFIPMMIYNNVISPQLLIFYMAIMAAIHSFNFQSTKCSGKISGEV